MICRFPHSFGNKWGNSSRRDNGRAGFEPIALPRFPKASAPKSKKPTRKNAGWAFQYRSEYKILNGYPLIALSIRPCFMQEVQTFMRLWVPPIFTRTFCRLGIDRRFVRLFERLTLFPTAGPLPHISHRCAIISHPAYVFLPQNRNLEFSFPNCNRKLPGSRDGIV